MEAVRRIEADQHRSADTHLIALALPSRPDLSFYLKDESSHPTGSLKHRLARSLFLYGLCNGWLREGRTVIEASSGSTAVSEAYFARMLGLPFIAVVPRSCAAIKIAAIRFQGGEVHFVDCATDAYTEAARLAHETGGHYLDQFTYSERATDWRGNNNIAESIFDQLRDEPCPIPAWVVCGAGTGGTSATIGRYIRYRRLSTRLCVADPEASAFHRHFADPAAPIGAIPETSIIEGIGRPRVEPSFMLGVVDRMIAVSDACSIGAMRALSDVIGRPCGGSTGTNMWACAQIMSGMRADVPAAVVAILCDGGDRYRDTLFDDAWLDARAIHWRPARDAIARFIATGDLVSPGS